MRDTAVPSRLVRATRFLPSFPRKRESTVILASKAQRHSRLRGTDTAECRGVRRVDAVCTIGGVAQ